MNGLFTIVWKEIRDNLRDKRSLFFALLYGPLLMPALMMAPLLVTANKNIQDYDTGKVLHVYGSEKAPNLIQHLRSRNLDAKEVGAGYQEKIKSGDFKVVLEITDTYGEKLLTGDPAKVRLHFLEQSQDSRNSFWQIKNEIDAYSRSIASQRMMIRGFDQQLLQPIDVVKNNLSEDEFGTSFLSKAIVFLAIFSGMMGGFYLAVDITPGERERNSLEPLLSLSLSRFQVLLAKFLAVLCFCLVSSLLPIISSGIFISFLPDNFFGNADVPSVITYLKLVLLMAPICVLVASALMALSASSKSVKEAQTQFGIAMIIPVAPFIALQFMNLQPNTFNSAIPFLGQHFLAEKIMMDSTFPLAAVLPSAVASLMLALLLLCVTTFLYNRDEILM